MATFADGSQSPLAGAIGLLPRAAGVLDRLAQAAPIQAGPLTIRWDAFDLQIGETSALEFAQLQLRSSLLDDAGITGDLRLAFRQGRLVSDPDESYFRRPQVDGGPLGLDDLHADGRCVALKWTDGQVDRWLRQLAPNFSEQSASRPADVTLRALFGAAGERLIQEIRLDWAARREGSAEPPPYTFALPGLKLSAPGATRFTLLLRLTDDGPKLAFCLTLPANQPVTASSDFAWERDGQRELHNDAERGQKPDAQPLFAIELRPTEEVTLALLQIDLGRAGLPTFFKQLGQPLAPLDFGRPEALGAPTPFAPGDLGGSWTGRFKLNTGDDFKLPFLNQGDGASQQFIRIDPPTFGEEGLEIAFPSAGVTLPFGITVTIGGMQFKTGVEIEFNWQTFALKVRHDQGIELISEQQKFEPDDEFLGLKWRLKGAPITTGPNKDKHHYFTLATQDHNYKLMQAPGSVLELEFDKLSSEGEPIVFAVSDFALAPSGVNLAARVLDRPARLNGIDTRFTFDGSSFQIQNSRIVDFTLSGSGPLPPALVGDAQVAIKLQFSQRGSGLALVAGKADLKSNKPLVCRGTRFQFSVSALGLKFVDDGRFHLYFTLTGSAQFVPLPSDDKDSPLALLSKIRIDLVECPLTGDVSVIAKHVKFLIELPKPRSFNFFGCFEMELRAIGFLPQADVFDGDGAMHLTGQLKFAQGPGDTPDARPDYHELFIGLPAPGSFVPRIHFTHLPVNLNIGAAFRLNGVVDFVRRQDEQGFLGEGSLQIQGLPTFAASFGFLRVRRSPESPWLRAWFIYLEVRQVTFQIPVIQIYLREVGLGFGYRFTLVSIKAADRTNDVRALLKELQALSRTQGDLSKRDRWSVDLEEPGRDPRWTIVLRAMLSQTAAAPSPLRFEAAAEANIACLFLFDAVIALRSDLTFFMAVRGWLYTNYADFVNNVEDARSRPLFSGFVLLSPRQKRFLAHVANNPGVKPGIHPRLPDFVREAIAGSRFSATLLIEPGLLHFELGWPNMLSWKGDLGPLKAEFQGGFIFRISRSELVIGSSYLARATLEIAQTFDFGIVGARISAFARVAYGARYIGVLDFSDPASESALYGAIGLEARIDFAIEVWIKIKLIFKTIKLSFRLSLTVVFTAGLEVGLNGLTLPGLRGSGTIGVKAFGRSLQLTVKLGIREGEVQKALARTERFLHVGLEATEVEAVPGLAPGVLGAAERFARLAAPRPLRAALVLGEGEREFKTPGYSIFVIRRPSPPEPDGWSYFVLLPQGEQLAPGEDGELAPIAETGFLPAPPDDNLEVADDFYLNLPADDDGAAFELEQFFYDSASASGGDWKPPQRFENGTIHWKVAWDTPFTVEGEIDSAKLAPDEHPAPPPDAERKPLTLAAYMRYAFRYTADPDSDAIVITGDPDPLPPSAPLEDQRVHNPSDSSFEAAVRGAVEQFGGSPFFKKDRNSAYDQLLDAAFSDATTIYRGGGAVPAGGTLADEKEADALQQNQQVHQLRGMIVQDLIGDLRDYAGGDAGARAGLQRGGISFRMGLVFRARGALPPWLQEIAGDGQVPHIRQRSGPGSQKPSDVARPARTFNVLRTDFAAFPPQFRRVKQFADAGTIALTWDLAWEHALGDAATPAQADPEHHLAHYQVRRRALDSREREALYTVKPAETLHRAASGDSSDILTRLRPRFQVVDHFEDAAGDTLPATGRSYLYTITPIDFAGSAGQPLTLIATRFPNQPPRVPTNGELVVSYQLSQPDLLQSVAPEPATPEVIMPGGVAVEWTEPGADVPIAQYLLIFRREDTLPIGSYGLDSATQRPPVKALPTSNARPLPTDIKIALRPQRVPRSADTPFDRRAELAIAELQGAGVLPQAGGAWRPEAWRMFLQTVSANGVPSALAPVQLLLRFAGQEAGEREERRPAELEWLPYPIAFPALPPEDERAIVDSARFPMPALEIATVEGPDGQPREIRRAPRFAPAGDALAGAAYQPHPKDLRCIRFRWNQGPSGQPGYPLDLSAGYELLELDADAHADDTFADPGKLAAALRRLQEIQMLPAEDLLLTPGDTLNTSQWEAWYPSALLRRRDPAQRAGGSELPAGPWHSWRESYLEWPRWPRTDAALPSLTEGGRRDGPLHPFLKAIVDTLQANPARLARADGQELPTFAVDLQISPPMQPGDFEAFQQSTAPRADPYGWGVLQRFGLSLAFSLRDAATGELKPSGELLAALQAVLEAFERLGHASYAEFREYLHVELLFQPGRSVRLGDSPGAPGTEDLLALVQLSLRPAIRQHLRYGGALLTGQPNAQVNLLISIPPGAPCSLIVQSDPAAGQIELAADPDQPTTISRSIWLPLNGETRLLARAAQLPVLGLALANQLGTAQRAALQPFSSRLAYQDDVSPRILLLQPLDTLTPGERATIRAALDAQNPGAADALFGMAPLSPLPVTDERSTYFTAPLDELAAAFARPATDLGAQWLRFKRYAESLNSGQRDSADPQIAVPTGQTQIADVLPAALSWMQRFFDAGGDPAADEAGPWLATAYPRAGSPAYSTPDASGRLTYDHLLQDQWAHAYRYYIRPYSRYDQLWQSLLRSPALFPEQQLQLPAVPISIRGGLDVVLDRTRPVDKPLVISSRRLDAHAAPAQPPVPGPTWEVIVAQHHEQTLVEHNATLARQLAFRQVAFTLLRRFAYPEWPQRIGDAFGTAPVPIVLVEHQYPPIPAAYPDTPDHIDLDTPLAPDVATSLALPERIGAFDQGALALQWEALPFFYEHRLLLIAQTASTVSPVNEVIQRDFEYRSPEPAATLEGARQIGWQPPRPYVPVPPPDPSCDPGGAGDQGAPVAVDLRSRLAHIPLRQLWDSLPPQAQRRWAGEEPDGPDSARPERKPAALPDLEVVYQVIEVFSGNVEVQAELFYQPPSGDQAGGFRVRQLGQRFLAAIAALTPPGDDAPQGDYVLSAALHQVTEQELSIGYEAQRACIPAPTRHKVAFKNRLFSLVGPLASVDLANLKRVIKDPADQAILDSIHLSWYSQEPISGPFALDQLPEELRALVDFPAKTDCTLVWAGELPEAERAALLGLPGDEAFARALQELAQRAPSPGAGPDAPRFTAVVALPGPDQAPPALEGLVDFTIDTEGQNYTGMTWQGPLSDDKERALHGWAHFPAFIAAIDALAQIFDSRTIVKSIPEGENRPSQVSLAREIRSQLIVGATSLEWRGRLRDEGQLAALEALKQGQDAPFQQALQAIADDLRAAGAVSVPFAAPIRPRQEQLPEILRERLLIARAHIRYHGLMTSAEGQQLQAQPGGQPDRDAIQRLYETSLTRGLRGRELRIRARRGSAAPSRDHEFTLPRLPAPED